MNAETATLKDQTADYIVVLVSCPLEDAPALAETLVQEDLCACVNIIPNILSVYRWQGDLISDQESLLVMKTMGKIYDRLEARVKELHPYEVPEIICLNIERGSKSYLDWIAAAVCGEVKARIEVTGENTGKQ